MLRIRYSASVAEIDLEGTGDDLTGLKNAILDMLKTGASRLVVPAATEYDPSPYDTALSAVSVVTGTGERGRATVADDRLLFVAPERTLRNFAANLPYNALLPASGIPYHVHYDRISFDEYLADDSMDLILALRGN